MIRSIAGSRRQRLSVDLARKLSGDPLRNLDQQRRRDSSRWSNVHQEEANEPASGVPEGSKDSKNTTCWSNIHQEANEPASQPTGQNVRSSMLQEGINKESKTNAKTVPPNNSRQAMLLQMLGSSTNPNWERVEFSFGALEELVQEQEESNDNDNPPIVDASLVDRVLIHWQRWLSRQATLPQLGTSDQVVSIVQKYQKRMSNTPLWSQESYRTILAGYRIETDKSRGGKAISVVRQAKEFLESMVLEARANRAVSPTGYHFSLLLDMQVQVGDLKAAKEVLEFILNNSGDHGHNNPLRVPSTSFEKLLQACVQLPKEQHKGKMADSFLDLLMRLHHQKLLAGVPQTELYTQVVNAWAKSGDPKGGTRALEIWNYLDQQARGPRGKHPLEPDGILVSTIINALARLGQATEAEQFLQEVQANRPRIKVTTSGLNSVLNAWSRAHTKNAGERAERFLRDVLQKQGRADGYSYTSVIHAWGTSQHPDAVQRATLLFGEMNNLAETTNPDLEPTTITYGSLLNCYAKAGDVPRAAQLLGTMCTNYTSGRSLKAVPNEQCFAIVLDAMARSNLPESGLASEELLRKMETSGIQGVVPGYVSYNTVINAWARSGDPEAGVHAERLLREMHEKFQQGNKSFAPRLETYNIVIGAWSRCESARDAERLLRELQFISSQPRFAHMKPDTLTYHAIMRAYATAGNPEGTEALHKEMISQSASNRKCQPNEETLRLCLEAWARSGHPSSGDAADDYLEMMDRQYPNEMPHRHEMRHTLAIMAWESQRNKVVARPRLQLLHMKLAAIRQGKKT